MNKLYLFLPIIFFALACKKPNERSCLKKSGNQTKKIINPGDFSRVYLKEHLNFVLVQDSVNYLVVEGGENLIDFVDYSIIDNELIISENNKCKFLRYKTGELNVEIHFKSIEKITFQGTELLTNRNDWNFNHLSILLKDSGGSIKLSKVYGNSINVVNSHGWGDITLSGSVNYFRAEMAGNGYFDSRELMVIDSISVLSNSSTISKMNADSSLLKAQLKAIGDVWYFGHPTQIWKEELGTGKLVEMN